MRNTLNVTVNGTEVTIPLTQYNPNPGIFTPDYSAIVKGLILKMANGEEIKLGDLLTDNQVAQISTLINAFKEEFNAQKSDSLANEYMTAFAKQQLPPPAPAPAPAAPAAPASSMFPAPPVNSSANETAVNETNAKGAAPKALSPVNSGANKTAVNGTNATDTVINPGLSAIGSKSTNSSNTKSNIGGNIDDASNDESKQPPTPIHSSNNTKTSKGIKTHSLPALNNSESNHSATNRTYETDITKAPSASPSPMFPEPALEGQSNGGAPTPSPVLDQNRTLGKGINPVNNSKNSSSIPTNSSTKILAPASSNSSSSQSLSISSKGNTYTIQLGEFKATVTASTSAETAIQQVNDNMILLNGFSESNYQKVDTHLKRRA